MRWPLAQTSGLAERRNKLKITTATAALTTTTTT
jgi:hypothetical protein